MANDRADRVLWNLLGGEMQNYNAHLARAVGGNAEAAFIFYVARWTRHDQDGWCYRTEADVYYDMNLTARQLRRVRDVLASSGILIEQRRGHPARMYYRICTDVLLKRLAGTTPIDPPVHPEDDGDNPGETPAPVLTKGHNKSLHNVTTSPDEMSGLTYNHKETNKREINSLLPREQKVTTGKRKLPRTWTISEQERQYATAHGLDPEQTALEFREFYWSSGATWSDWHLVFLRWCREQKKRAEREAAQSGRMDTPTLIRRDGSATSEYFRNIAQGKAPGANGNGHPREVIEGVGKVRNA